MFPSVGMGAAGRPQAASWGCGGLRCEQATPPAPPGLSPRSDSDGMSLFPFVFDSLRSGFSAASANPSVCWSPRPSGRPDEGDPGLQG